MEIPRIKLIQKADTRTIPFKSCLISVDYLVTKCATFDDAQVVEDGFFSEILFLGNSGCTELHRTAIFHFPSGGIITGLMMNHTTFATHTVAGNIDKNGDCLGTSYASDKGSWRNVVVQGNYKIQLSEGIASIISKDGLLILLTGTRMKLSEIIAEVDFGNFKNTISNLSVPVGFTWLLKPEPKVEEAKFVLSSIKSSVQDCKNFIKNNDFEAIKLYLQSELYIPDNIVGQIAKDTIGQSENPLWVEYRKSRITASKFGAILAACKRGKFPKSLFKSLENNANIQGIYAVQGGVSNEINSIKVLEENENVKVVPTGLWLSNNGFLGASPDGLVNYNYIVEVKCPWKYRNKNLETEIEKNLNYIVYKENNIILINKNHVYWDQIQGQLYLTKRKCCYLVVWTPGQSIIMEIE
ncbi:hypothetical protein AGLY_017396 [Aphis glycines]|uniref:YqaJ viral recombinase domain-containing protein n=1 Tax=Aphis glycines TaxID=307491 RepID=A0A6G0SW82_APHGL|nr:hypothetical protein AGLY_017396 [Aphis glycines]